MSKNFWLKEVDGVPNWIATLVAIGFFLLCATLIGLLGCCPTQQVIRPADTVYVPVAFTDTLTLVRVDSVYTGSSERILVRIDTVFKKAWVRVLDTVRVVVPPDTVQSPVIELPPTLWNSKKFWLPFGALGLLIGVGLCLYLIKKFKP
jgi:hypothetical protein